MPRTTQGTCTYCGNTFTYRKEPLGRSICPVCLNLLREKYQHSLVTHLASEFHVGIDAIKAWAQRHRIQRRLVCVRCGREFAKFNAAGECPICALTHRVS